MDECLLATKTFFPSLALGSVDDYRMAFHNAIVAPILELAKDTRVFILVSSLDSTILKKVANSVTDIEVADLTVLSSPEGTASFVKQFEGKLSAEQAAVFQSNRSDPNFKQLLTEAFGVPRLLQLICSSALQPDVVAPPAAEWRARAIDIYEGRCDCRGVVDEQASGHDESSEEPSGCAVSDLPSQIFRQN